jgi:thiamine biosynthesis lipoprotein
MLPAPGWRCVALDGRRLRLPTGVRLDLGATAKAVAADRITERIVASTGCGVLVSLGGDLAVAGQAPDGGWAIGVGADHEHPGPDDPVVCVAAGGLATSSTTRRRWRQGGVLRHHIVDPRTGANPPGLWRAVSVCAASCLHANTASTAAVLLGEAAPAWLERHGLPARLVNVRGAVRTVGGWPARDAAGAAV